MIGSLLKHPEGLPDGVNLSLEDVWTPTDRKSIASGRLVSKHWARTITLCISDLSARGKAPALSMLSLDSFTFMRWDTTERHTCSRECQCRGLKQCDPETLLDLRVGGIASALSKLSGLDLILPAGKVRITGLMDGFAAHGVLTYLCISGQFSGVGNVLQDVARLTSLRTLDINLTLNSISEGGFRTICSMTGLTALRMDGGKWVTDSGIRTLTSSLTGLKRLQISGFLLITNESLVYFAELAEVGNLSGLWILGSPRITGEAWSAFKRRLSPRISDEEKHPAFWLTPNGSWV